MVLSPFAINKLVILEFNFVKLSEHQNKADRGTTQLRNKAYFYFTPE